VTGFNHGGGSDATHPSPTSLPQPTIKERGARDSRLGLNQLLLHDLPLDEQVAVASGLGVTAVGLLRLSLWRSGDQHTALRLRDTGLGVTSLSWAGGFTGTAGFTFREAVADGRLALREATMVGAETLVIAPGGRGSHTLRHAQRVVVEGLKYLADEAAARRVRLAVKCDLLARRPRWTCVQSLDTARLILDRVETPWVGLACPILPVHTTGPDPLEQLARRIHLARLPLPTDGALDQTAVERWRQRLFESWARLQRGGFQGDWEFSPESPVDRTTLASSHWPAVRAAVAVVHQGMSEFATAESGSRTQAW
jgi:sugar phosphate isomerase/epimerase